MAEKIVTTLPCRIGDTVFGVRPHNNGRFLVTSGVVYHMEYIGREMALSISLKNWCRGEWGKTIFGTKEEAEAEAKRRMNL